MSFVSRGIVVPLVALVLGATSFGCASSSAPDEEDPVAAVSADALSSDGDLANAIDLSAEQRAKLAAIDAGDARYHDDFRGGHPHPSIDQIVDWFTTTLGLTPRQAARLRAYLEAHGPGAAPGHR